jgi:hypothetical protein
LAQYLDGSLPPIQRAEVEAHLAACEDCFEQVAAVAVLETEREHAREGRGGELVPLAPSPSRRVELAELRAKLPTRSSRRFVSEERLEALAWREVQPDEQLEGKERVQAKQRGFALLRQAFETLTSEEQVLLRMRTEFKVSEIARLRGMEQKPLYRRLEKINAKLRKELERHGIRRADIADLLGGLQPDDEGDNEDGSS